MRRASKVDQNQALVVAALRGMGADVIDTSGAAQLKPGFPDLLVGYRKRWVLIEIKRVKGRLTADEKIFHDEHGRHAPILIVFGVRDAVKKLSEFVSAPISLPKTI